MSRHSILAALLRGKSRAASATRPVGRGSVSYFVRFRRRGASGRDSYRDSCSVAKERQVMRAAKYIKFILNPSL
jgi:hypothetical protein